MERGSTGFTLLEVMVAMAVMAVALMAVFGSQSQSVSLASEAKFSTMAALLAQSKMAETDILDAQNLREDSGGFGEDFPGYSWQLTVNDVSSIDLENISNHLKQIDIVVSWGENNLYQYRLRQLRFFPEEE
jgi:general secretion pathway protein I